MNHQDEDKTLNDLYQQANHEQPPKALDELILNHAQQTGLKNSKTTPVTNKKNWRPWLAAASIVLVIPMVWLLTQSQQMAPDLGPIQPPESKPSINVSSTPKIAESMADGAEVEAEPSEQSDSENKKTTIANNRMRSKPEAPTQASMTADLQQMIEQQGQRSITGKPIDQESLEANKTLLMNEFKAKKRRIKPSTMDPLMLLEYEQFGRYLDQGNIDAADELLTEMQEYWPDYDFEDMIYRLATAEAAN